MVNEKKEERCYVKEPALRNDALPAIILEEVTEHKEKTPDPAAPPDGEAVRCVASSRVKRGIYFFTPNCSNNGLPEAIILILEELQ